jgi:hypothetical protein
MTNEEAMRICTDIGVHEGGMENWVMDNAWVKFANIVEAREREECAKVCEDLHPGLATKVSAEHIRARSKT